MNSLHRLSLPPVLRLRWDLFVGLVLSLTSGVTVIPAAPSRVEPLQSGKWPATPRLGGQATDIQVVGKFAYVAIEEGGLAVFEPLTMPPASLSRATMPMSRMATCR